MKEVGRAPRELRSPWLLLSWVIGLVLLAVGIGSVAEWERFDDIIPVSIFMTPGIWLTLRVPLCSVRIDEEGLRYRGLFRTKRFSWGEVTCIRPGVIGGGSLLTSVAPVLVLEGAEEVELAILAGYVRKSDINVRVSKQSSLMESLRVGRQNGGIPS
ncbi:PH domain-containing protein [Streptomyces fradiae]|uniref:PH domain-containing protein n=1 Tax=Streptomyces fradiae TaxID=1906 RepID=UPI003985D22D